MGWYRVLLLLLKSTKVLTLTAALPQFITGAAKMCKLPIILHLTHSELS